MCMYIYIYTCVCIHVCVCVCYEITKYNGKIKERWATALFLFQSLLAIIHSSHVNIHTLKYTQALLLLQDVDERPTVPRACPKGEACKSGECVCTYNFSIFLLLLLFFLPHHTSPPSLTHKPSHPTYMRLGFRLWHRLFPLYRRRLSPRTPC